MARPDHADDHEDDASISIGRIKSTKDAELARWDTAQMDTFLRSVLGNASFSQVRRPCLASSSLGACAHLGATSKDQYAPPNDTVTCFWRTC